WSWRPILANAWERAMPIDTAVTAMIRHTTSAMVAISSTPTMRHRVILFVETADAKPTFPVSSVMIVILRESVRCCGGAKWPATLSKLLRNKGDSAFLVNGVLTPRTATAIIYRCGFAATHSAGMAAAGLCSMAFFHPVFESVLLQIAAALDQSEPEIRRADIRLETVLLEEHPLHRLGAVDAVLGRQRRAAGDVPEDGIGLSEIAARRDFQQRHLAVRILGQKFRRVALALENVDLDQPVGHAQLRQGEPRLVAVARTLHRIERKHRRFPKSRAAVSRAYCAVTTSTRRCHGRYLGRIS